MKQRKYDQKIRNPFPYLAEIEASKLTCCERWRKPRPQAKSLTEILHKPKFSSVFIGPNKIIETRFKKKKKEILCLGL